MALGATRMQILVLAMREGVRLIGIGSALGVALALAATRALSNFLNV
jgi:ABC-type lipoprotein release transport system permease subunit